MIKFLLSWAIELASDSGRHRLAHTLALVDIARESGPRAAFHFWLHPDRFRRLRAAFWMIVFFIIANAGRKD